LPPRARRRRSALPANPGISWPDLLHRPAREAPSWQSTNATAARRLQRADGRGSGGSQMRVDSLGKKARVAAVFSICRYAPPQNPRRAPRRRCRFTAYAVSVAAHRRVLFRAKARQSICRATAGALADRGKAGALGKAGIGKGPGCAGSAGADRLVDRCTDRIRIEGRAAAGQRGRARPAGAPPGRSNASA
jgi:hypothetical protein